VSDASANKALQELDCVLLVCRACLHENGFLHLGADSTEDSDSRKPIFTYRHFDWPIDRAPSSAIAHPDVERRLVKVQDHLTLVHHAGKFKGEIKNGTSSPVQVLLVLITDEAVLDLVLHIKIPKYSRLDAYVRHVFLLQTPLLQAIAAP